MRSFALACIAALTFSVSAQDDSAAVPDNTRTITHDIASGAGFQAKSSVNCTGVVTVTDNLGKLAIS